MARAPAPLLVLLLAAPAAAEDACARLPGEIRAELSRVVPGETFGARIDRAMARAADALRADPSCADAYFWMAVLRLEYALRVPELAAETSNRLRAVGAPESQLAEIRETAALRVERDRELAAADFARMEQLLRQQGRHDPNLIQFANAILKMIGGELRTAARGERGAIGDLEDLVRRGYRAAECAEYLGKCYFTLATQAYAREEFTEAQKLWEEAYRWTRDPYMRRLIRVNQAGALQADNAFESAEKLLRQQIAEEPNVPDHWKNLGLVLGFQGRLAEALHAYARARELCGQIRSSFFVGLLHGNAWLRAATIHGTLLADDGDLREAWRLFLEYRAMFGDDYNFSLAFAEFCFHHGRFELAQRFYEHARDLQPRCKQAYQRLVELATKMPGTREAREQRLREARAAYEAIKARYDDREEDPNVLRMCAGTRDLIDGGHFEGVAPLLDPDPLAGLSAENPPAWLLEAAATRRPFRPFVPGEREGAGEERRDGEGGGGEGARGEGTLGTWLAGGAALLAALALFVLWRLRARPA